MMMIFKTIFIFDDINSINSNNNLRIIHKKFQNDKIM